MKTSHLKITGFALAALVVVTSGCKKFLDQKPITEVSSNVVFSDVPNAYKAVVGAYSRLMGDQGYGIRLSLYYTVDNDECQGPSGGIDDDRRGLARYGASPSNAQIEKPFNQLFQGIEFSNICIDNIPKMDMYSSGSEQQKKQLQRMYGEALTLRAQYYLEAIRNWGDLPMHLKPAYAQASENSFPSRMDRDSIYDVLIEDLKLAATLVPWRNEVTAIGDVPDERITKGAVKSLRARIALYRGGYSLRRDGVMKRGSNYQAFYQIAKDECTDIINSGQHSLNPSYLDLWKNQVCGRAVTDPNGELMFQASAIGNVSAEDSKLGYYNGPTVAGKGNKSINILPTYFYLFDSTDLRRDVTCAPYIVNNDGTTKAGQAITAINDGKYRRDWISNPVVDPNSSVQYFSLKWQIMRYSDVLLMLAEAENELNGATAAAYEAVNQVRRRGYGKAINVKNADVDLPAGLSKSDFFKAIVKERALELGGEGQRKYDLIRWNLLATALNETKANLLNMSTSTPMVNPSYMSSLPTYSLTSALPTAMYFFTNGVAYDKALWGNNFYTYAPFTDPNVTNNVQTGDYTLLPTDFGVNVKGMTNTVTLPDAVANGGKIYWVKASPNNPAAVANKSWAYSMKVNAINGQTIDVATSNSRVYAGTVAAAPTATVNGPSSTIGFYSNGANWITATTATWIGAAINTTALVRFASEFRTGKGELLPIPQPVRDANKNFTQNPGY